MIMIIGGFVLFIAILFSGIVMLGSDLACKGMLKSLEQGGILDFIEAKVAEFIVKAFNFKCGIVV